METREIDMRLQQFTAAEHRIGANLQELEQHSVYQLLMTDELRGETARALRVVTQADPTMWDLFTMLSSALDAARKVRGTGNRLSLAERQELTHRLTEASVLVQRTTVPLGERSLTGDATTEQRLTIQALINRMSAMYEPIRDVVTHAEKVLREILPRLNSAEATLTRLRSDADMLGVDTVELDRVEESIIRYRELSFSDPLSIPPNARVEFDDAIRAIGSAIASARSSHDELATDLAAASELLHRCRSLILDAHQARQDALAKIAHPVGLRQPPSLAAIDGERGMAARLDPILNSSGRWQDIRAELDQWATRATRFMEQLERVVAANTRPLAKRDELRGRLAAFRAKMMATGRSEDPVLNDLSAEAHNELFTAPTDLIRGERLVTEFGKRMAS